MKFYRKRILFLVLTAALCLFIFSGCNKSEENYAFFSSYMTDGKESDDLYSDVIEEPLLSSEALFAYKIDKTEINTVQTVFVWKNLLRRNLRLDIIQIYDAVPDKDKDITIKIDEEIKINNKVIEFTPSSELSFAVLRAIFPKEFKVNAKTFRNTFREMIIRLETIDYLGDTEVIAIRTTAKNGLLLEKIGDTGVMTKVMSLDEIFGINATPDASSFPAEPPTLTVSDGEMTITAWRGTSSWMIVGEDGLGSGITADSPHPLECKDDIQTIKVSQNTTLTLSFESAPTSIAVKRYKLNATDYDAFEKIADFRNIIEVKAGNYLYEVIAKWEDNAKPYSGTVYYAFCTEK